MVCMECSGLGGLEIQWLCNHEHQEKSKGTENLKKASHGQRAMAEWISKALADAGFIRDIWVFSEARAGIA